MSVRAGGLFAGVEKRGLLRSRRWRRRAVNAMNAMNARCAATRAPVPLTLPRATPLVTARYSDRCGSRQWSTALLTGAHMPHSPLAHGGGRCARCCARCCACLLCPLLCLLCPLLCLADSLVALGSWRMATMILAATAWQIPFGSGEHECKVSCALVTLHRPAVLLHRCTDAPLHRIAVPAVPPVCNAAPKWTSMPLNFCRVWSYGVACISAAI